LAAAQKELEEIEEQEIINKLMKDSSYYILSKPIKDLLENLLKTKHSQIKLSLKFIGDSCLIPIENGNEIPLPDNEYFLNKVPVKFQGEELTFTNSKSYYNISSETELYHFIHPKNRNKPYNLSEEGKELRTLFDSCM